jgi:hypothetical protein
MEVKEAFHKWANGGNTVVAYGPREDGGYSLLEYNGGKPQELFRSDSLEEIQAAFRDYYAVKAQFETGMPWKVAGNHMVICREGPDGKFEVREYNSFTRRIGMALERCDTLKEAEKTLEKYAELASSMTDFNSLTERKSEFDRAIREAGRLAPESKLPHVVGQAATRRTIEVGR